MVELEKKYEMGVKRFGFVNWIGVWTLYKKETLRFINVWIQTLFSPLITSLLFLFVLSLIRIAVATLPSGNGWLPKKSSKPNC